MNTQSEAPEISEEAPAAKSTFTIVVILAVTAGILLAVIVAGVFFHYQSSKNLRSEVLAVKNSLKEKNLALDGMKEKIETLSKQMHVLKEYSIARSSTVVEKSKKTESAVPVVEAAENASKPPAAKEKSESPQLPIPAKAIKPKPEIEGCELVGKSPEDQATTLQRCVSMIDPPREKARSR